MWPVDDGASVWTEVYFNLFYYIKNSSKARTLAPQIAVLVWENNRVWKDENSRPKTKRTPYKAQRLSLITSLLFLNIPKRFLPWSGDMAPLSDIKGGRRPPHLGLPGANKLSKPFENQRFQSAAKLSGSRSQQKDWMWKSHFFKWLKVPWELTTFTAASLVDLTSQRPEADLRNKVLCF